MFKSHIGQTVKRKYLIPVLWSDFLHNKKACSLPLKPEPCVLAELDANCSQAVEDLLASYHSDKAYYELCGPDILISNNRVIGADEEISVEKVFKTIEKRNSENDFSGRRKKSLNEVSPSYDQAG